MHQRQNTTRSYFGYACRPKFGNASHGTASGTYPCPSSRYCLPFLAVTHSQNGFDTKHVAHPPDSFFPTFCLMWYFFLAPAYLNNTSVPQ